MEKVSIQYLRSTMKNRLGIYLEEKKKIIAIAFKKLPDTDLLFTLFAFSWVPLIKKRKVLPYSLALSAVMVNEQKITPSRLFTIKPGFFFENS